MLKLLGKGIAMLLSLLISVIPIIKDYILYGEEIIKMSNQTVSKAVELYSDDKIAYFTVSGEDGDIKCAISFCGKAGWRFQSEYNGKISDYGASQLLSYYLREENNCKREVISITSADNNAVIKEENGSCVEITYSPFVATFKTASGKVAGQISNIAVRDKHTLVRGILDKNEAMWGGGEHFDHVNQRGQHVYINAVDKWCETNGNSYMPIPILISSRGSGFFMNRYERMSIDVDSRIVPNNIWQFKINDAPCDLFVYTTEKPADVLYGYSLLTGFSPEPAEWTYGTTVCRYSPDFSTLQGILDMVNAMEENDFPWDAVIIESFNTYDKAGLKQVCDIIHSMRKKVLLWIPTGKSGVYALEDETKYFVKRASDGSINLPEADGYNPEDNPTPSTARYYDITSDATREYLYNRVWESVTKECGVDGAKADFCELFPDYYELSFADGKTSGAHHWYPVVFNTLLYNKFSEKEDGGMIFARGGSIGAQRYPFVWMGDQKREFKFIKAQLKGVLSSGISGVPFTSYDMAGYKYADEENEEAIFERSVEFTAFTGNIQTHGDVKRPYDFGEETKAIYRRYAKIHDALRPYIVEQGKISSETGLPLVRHLALSFWNDKNVWDIEDEFMLGESLLIAPVLNNSTSRTIYLPEGKWINFWTGKEYDGGKKLRNFSAPRDEVPVFIKADAQSEAFLQVKDDILKIK